MINNLLDINFIIQVYTHTNTIRFYNYGNENVFLVIKSLQL